MDDKQYTLPELIDELSSIRWAEGESDAEEALRWDRWIEVNEENRSLALKAQKIISGFSFDGPIAPRVDKEWQDIKDAITQPQNSSQPVYKPGRKRADVFSLFIKIAALILIISSAGFSFYLYKQNEEVQQEIAVQEIKTAYGEKKTI